MIVAQTTALLVDAYRELNAKKLFWITLILSAVVVLGIASVGINPRGLSFFGATLPLDFFNSNFIEPQTFYDLIFAEIGVKIWLTWAATILALISTAGIFPDLISGGSIETVLSKPIGRFRLFVTKYVTGLLFVALQVTVFAVGMILVIGLRAGKWDPLPLIAIPIVLVFFSYLFSVCVLLGILTRSTIASLLMTILFWLIVLFGVGTADTNLQMFLRMAEARVEDAQDGVTNIEEATQARIDSMRSRGEPVPGDDGLPEGAADQLEVVTPYLVESRQQLETAERGYRSIKPWADSVGGVATVLPKAGGTVNLLTRYLVSEEEIRGLAFASEGVDPALAAEDPEAIEDPTRIRSPLWIVGTSLIFEGVMLVCSCWMFVRRDY